MLKSSIPIVGWFSLPFHNHGGRVFAKKHSAPPHTTSIDRVFDLLGQILEGPPIINSPFQTTALVTNLLCHYFDDAHLLYISVSF
jgi:hypothetical protein